MLSNNIDKFFAFDGKLLFRNYQYFTFFHCPLNSRNTDFIRCFWIYSRNLEFFAPESISRCADSRIPVTGITFRSNTLTIFHYGLSFCPPTTGFAFGSSLRALFSCLRSSMSILTTFSKTADLQTRSRLCRF